MFGLLKTKNPYEQNAKCVYGTLLSYIRNPVFYERFGVPDTLDGRFDLLLLHGYMVIDYMLGQEDSKASQNFNQALFDVTFADMDQTLREIGIGDMGLPKHMRRMMKAFNGRVHAYSEAVKEGTLQQALHQNLYGTAPETDEKALEKMASYVDKQRLYIAKNNTQSAVLSGEIRLMDLNNE